MQLIFCFTTTDQHLYLVNLISQFGSDSQATGVTLLLPHMILYHTKKLEIILVTVFLQSIDMCIEHDMVKAKVNH